MDSVKIEATSTRRNPRVAKKDLWRGNSSFSWARIVQKSQGSGLSRSSSKDSCLLRRGKKSSRDIFQKQKLVSRSIWSQRKDKPSEKRTDLNLRRWQIISTPMFQVSFLQSLDIEEYFRSRRWRGGAERASCWYFTNVQVRKEETYERKEG